MENFSGKILSHIGITLLIIAAIAGLALLIVFKIRASKLKQKLDNEYGPSEGKYRSNPHMRKRSKE